MRRNRLHLWIFLSKNPSLVQFRKRDKPEVTSETQSENEGNSLSNNEALKTNDIEENKDNQNDTDKFERVDSSSFVSGINMSDDSYKEKNI